MNLTNLNLMIYHADLQPARGIISRAFFFAKKRKRLQRRAGNPRPTKSRLRVKCSCSTITRGSESPFEVWLRDGTASYQTKTLETAYGQAVYPASQVLRRVCQEPFLTSYAENSIPQNGVGSKNGLRKSIISSSVKSGILYV